MNCIFRIALVVQVCIIATLIIQIRKLKKGNGIPKKTLFVCKNCRTPAILQNETLKIRLFLQAKRANC